MDVLIISPHLDDEVLGCGGTISRYIDEGHDVSVCFICKRAYNHEYVDKWIKQEKKDAISAKNILGYRTHYFLDLHDELLYEELQDVIIELENVVHEEQPDIVFMPHKGDSNQDHRTVFEACLVCFRSFTDLQFHEIYCYEVPSSTEQTQSLDDFSFHPDTFINVDGYLDRKLDAWQCYDREGRDFPHPRSSRAVRAHAVTRGSQAHVNAAEAFQTFRRVKY